MTAQDVINQFGLEPLPTEGGYYRQSWQHRQPLPPEAFPGRNYKGPRFAGSAIYALLTPRDFSALHRVKTDEVWHFYGGDTLEMLNLFPGGAAGRILLGQRFAAGEIPQYVVPAGVWQGTRPVGGKESSNGWSLVGCTMAPGFDWSDFELGDRTLLQTAFPEARDDITALTRVHS